MRKILLACLLALISLAPAFAQAPPPVPALPDTERRTQYAISSQTGPFNVGFQVYGDGSDYSNWVQVYLNGIQQVGNWSLTSPSGSIALLARPITDAQITFTAPQTGTLQIVGARRPRQTSQYQEGRGVAARDLNQRLTDATAELRELWDRQARTVQGPPGDTLSVLPPAASRAGFLYGFDGTGNSALYPATLGGGAGPCATAAQGLVPATGGNPLAFLAGDCTFKTISTGSNSGNLGIATSSYASGSALTTTGTIGAGSSSLLLASALDFANGQGVLILGAGPAITLGAVSAPVITQNGTTGSTTYTYAISTCDAAGGIKAAVTGQITNGNSTLSGVNSIRVNFTQPLNGNCFLIWKKIGTGAYTYFESVSVSATQSMLDEGQTAQPRPFWVPATPPVADQPDWLVATITNGGGTTNLTLSATATTAVTGAFTAHDDTTGLNSWIAAINVNCGFATVTAGTYRISAPLNSLTCNGVSITGQGGSNFLPAGAVDTTTEHGVINVTGTGAGASIGSLTCLEGVVQLSNLGSITSGWARLDMGNPGYRMISPIQITQTQNALAVPCATNFYASVETAVIQGTITATDQVSLIMTSGSITGSPVTVTYTVSNGDTLTNIAHQLAILINTTAALSGSGGPPLVAWNNNATIYVGYPGNVTIAWSSSVTGAQTEGVVFGTGSNFDTIAPWTPLVGATITGISGDGTNMAGRNNSTFPLIYLADVANARVSQIYGQYFGSSMLRAVNGYNNSFANITAYYSGSEGNNDLSFVGQTKLMLRDISSTSADGFGPGIGSSSWVQISNLTVDGAQSGRGFKSDSTAQGLYSNIVVNNVNASAIAFSGGSWKIKVTNFAAYGSLTGPGGGGVWTSDQFNRYLSFFNGSALTNTPYNVALSASDTQGALYAVQYGASGLFLNTGNANTSYNVNP